MRGFVCRHFIDSHSSQIGVDDRVASNTFVVNDQIEGEACKVVPIHKPTVEGVDRGNVNAAGVLSLSSGHHNTVRK